MWRRELVDRLRDLEHPAWGPAHNTRLFALAMQIAEEEGEEVDEDVVFAAAWLHDIGTFPEYACGSDNPPECAATGAESLLPELGFPIEKVAPTASVIREHDFEGVTRESAEARVLRDADMLEFLGAVGLVRLLSLVGLEDWVPDPATAVALATQFGQDLPDKLLYVTSRRIAAQRLDETRAFMAALTVETADLTLV